MLPRHATFEPNVSHVPVRPKFVAPPLLSKAALSGKSELEFLVAQESSIGKGLHTALHLATAATVACDKMLRDDVPQDVQSLIRGQSVLVESLIGDLLTTHANLTLRQRDVLLKNSKLPSKESESLWSIPLFDTELFPCDLLALDARLTASQFQVNQQLVFEKLAKTSSSSSVPSATVTSEPRGKAKKQNQKPAQTRSYSRGRNPRGRGRGAPQSKTATHKSPSRAGDKPAPKP